MVFDPDAVAAALEDFGGTVTAPDGTEAPALLTEGDVFRNDGQQDVRVGSAILRIASGSLPLKQQAEWCYQETPGDPARYFVVRNWERVGAGRFTDVIVVEA
jgi:hypothetical protein